jgi:hypothetical protein
MTAKLTLSIDSKIIEKAKKYAKKEGKSLSSMVEDFLAFSTQKDTLLIINQNMLETVEKLAGSLKMKLTQRCFDIKKDKQNSTRKKNI